METLDIVLFSSPKTDRRPNGWRSAWFLHSPHAAPGLGFGRGSGKADEILAIPGLCETLTIEGVINCSLNINDGSYIFGAWSMPLWSPPWMAHFFLHEVRGANSQHR